MTDLKEKCLQVKVKLLDHHSFEYTQYTNNNVSFLQTLKENKNRNLKIEIPSTWNSKGSPESIRGLLLLECGFIRYCVLKKFSKNKNALYWLVKID